MDALLLRNMIIQGYGYPFGDTDATLVLKTLIGEREGLAMMRAMAKARMEAHETKQRAVGLPIHDSLSDVNCSD